MKIILFCLLDIIFIISILKIFMSIKQKEKLQDIKIKISTITENEPENKISRYFIKRGKRI